MWWWLCYGNCFIYGSRTQPHNWLEIVSNEGNYHCQSCQDKANSGAENELSLKCTGERRFVSDVGLAGLGRGKLWHLGPYTELLQYSGTQFKICYTILEKMTIFLCVWERWLQSCFSLHTEFANKNKFWQVLLFTNQIVYKKKKCSWIKVLLYLGLS